MGTTEINFSDFKVIKPITRKPIKQVISIFEDGNLSINGALRSSIGSNIFEMRIKNDCSQVALFPDGKIKIDMGKNNRVKNFDIIECLNKKKIKFPVYYLGNWNEDSHVWRK